MTKEIFGSKNKEKNTELLSIDEGLDDIITGSQK